MLLELLGLVLLIAAGWVLWEVHALSRCPVGAVLPGAHATLVAASELPSLQVASTVAEGLRVRREPGEVDGPHVPGGGATPEIGTRPGAFLDAAVPSGLALGAGFADWMKVDENVLDAVGQWTHTDLHDKFDLLGTVHENHYQLTKRGFEIKLRGHVGEQEVADQLGSWAGTYLSLPDASNNPGFDLTLGGHDFNVKVGESSAAIAEHLHTHPDVPVMVNADMADLPSDAFHVDLTHAVDPDVLAEHSVVVVDGLLLSDLQDQMADAFGPGFHDFGVEDFFDGAADLGIPVLGSVIRVVRSGVREGRLVAHHGDKTRAAKNVATDAVVVGGHVAGYGLVGSGIGAMIDILSFGATGGLGFTVVGPALGSMLGGLRGGQAAAHRRTAPLRHARAAATAATKDYDTAVSEAVSACNSTWDNEIVPPAQNQMETAQRAADERLGWTLAHARRDLARVEEEARGLAISTVEARRAQLLSARPAFSVLARRRQMRWVSSAESAVATRDTGACLDVLCVTQGGPTQVAGLIRDVAQRRARITATVAEVARWAERDALEARLTVVRELEGQRELLRHRLKLKTHPAALNVWSAAELVRKELVATGTAKPEWVSTNLPSVPRPAMPLAVGPRTRSRATR